MRPFLLKIYGPKRERREVPRGSLVSVSFTDEQDGGSTSCSIECAAAVAALPTVQNGDSVEIWIEFEGVLELRYVGKIVRRNVSQEDGTTISFTVEGESAEIGRIMLNREFLLAGPPDLSELWREIAEEARRKHPDLLVVSSPVGLNASGHPAFLQNFGEANRAVIEKSGNRVGWGVRRRPREPGVRVLSLDRCARAGDPISAARTIPIPSRGVAYSEGERDATDIRNVAWIRGGVPKNPNRIPNADFRLIEFADESFRSLLLDRGFEDRSAAWVRENGASFKVGSNANETVGEGPARTGDDMVELDAPGERIAQTRGGPNVAPYLVPGHSFTAQAYLRKEQGWNGLTRARLKVTWLRADGSSAGENVRDFLIDDAVWDLFEFTVPCPDDGTAVGFRFEVECLVGSVVVDDCNLFDSGLIVPRFHELRLFRTARQEGVNYLQTAIRHPHRSAYAPEFAIRSLDQDSYDAHFGMRDNREGGDAVAFDVGGNTALRFTVDLRSPRTPSGGVYRNGKFFLVVQWLKGDGARLGSEERLVIPEGAGFADWRQFAVVFTAPSTAAKGQVWITFRGGPTYSAGELAALGIPSSENGLSRILVGGFCAMAAGSQPQLLPSLYVGEPALPGVQWAWIPDGPFQTRIACTDVMPLGTPENLSIETYGEHPTFEEQEGVTTQEEALFFAEALFTAYAVEQTSGTLTLAGDRRRWLACSGLRLRGERGRRLSSKILAIRQATTKYDGDFEIDLSWGLSLDNPYQVLASFFEKKKKAAGTGAGGGYYGTSGSSGGGSGGGSLGGSLTPSYWGVSPRTSEDATQHDDYRPADGPHVQPAERLNWDAAREEVIEARDSAATGILHGSLDERLERLEEALIEATVFRVPVFYEEEDGSLSYIYLDDGGVLTMEV